jgi:hypothetical protein
MTLTFDNGNDSGATRRPGKHTAFGSDFGQCVAPGQLFMFWLDQSSCGWGVCIRFGAKITIQIALQCCVVEHKRRKGRVDIDPPLGQRLLQRLHRSLQRDSLIV